ncbi:MAG: hypothetical protein CL843_13130 [Crocinitomicaceae bacterium]|nr:hypothetical protein [Crocinitomicaceae bacterium]|tara:strand:- start:2019 stop:2705 length:687 start_codon:yes stop_codon:yes gene_type:complete
MRIHQHLQLVVLLLLFFIGHQIQAQTLEFNGNYSKNKLIDSYNDFSEYSVEDGYAFRFAIDDLYLSIDDHLLDSVRLRFAINLDHYKTYFDVYDGGMGGGTTYKADVSKTILSITAFPFNFRVFKFVDINLGLEYGFLIHDSFSGEYSSWQMNASSEHEELDDGDINVNSDQYLGLRSRIAFNIPLKKGFQITPQVSLYRGFLNDFKSINSRAKSYRYFIGMGIRKKL